MDTSFKDMMSKWGWILAVMVAPVAFSPLFMPLEVLAQGAEAPPFRAWWPIVNVEVEAGSRGFYAFDPDARKDGESKQR